ncbi:hypothetical protein [uncultured Methylophaga sp.]|uniref:hypothetical protein n=1 Tax=uncultured Methylophaga sp. TaxID=285271 RepID=UPI00263700BB|nr:hypothetical protein [uncultured Methylophaga sp.]|tara:strand:- start:253 stop:711 length:459 start_codon:yes stop_codon:yes gene_type:complete
MKLEFYDLLESNEDFCCALGKVMLVASKLEVLLKQYLRLHGKNISEKRATLGNLIKILKENGHLTKNGEIHFWQASLQRNYLIHNLYGSFVDEIEQALLPTEELVEMDVDVYTEKAQQTAENLGSYARLMQRAIEKHNNHSQQDAPSVAPLL